jgi:hypothetical protein
MKDELLSKWFDRPIAYHRIFVDLTGSVTAALMLSQAIYWSKRTGNREGWFYKACAEWTEETGLTRHEQDGARKLLKKLPFWKEKLAGVPATCNFRIDIQALYSSLSLLDNPVSGAEFQQTSLQKTGKHSITETTTETTTAESSDSTFQKGLFDASLRKSKKEKKPANPVFVACVHIWVKEVHPGWTFKPVDGKALNGIIAQMRSYSIKNREVEPSEEQLVIFFKHITTHLPAFYKSQTLSVINSKFDPIIDEIKTGRNPNQPARQSGWDFAASL